MKQETIKPTFHSFPSHPQCSAQIWLTSSWGKITQLLASGLSCHQLKQQVSQAAENPAPTLPTPPHQPQLCLGVCLWELFNVPELGRSKRKCFQRLMASHSHFVPLGLTQKTSEDFPPSRKLHMYNYRAIHRRSLDHFRNSLPPKHLFPPLALISLQAP